MSLSEKFVTVLLVLAIIIFIIAPIGFVFAQRVAFVQTFEATIVKTYIDRGNTYFVLQKDDGTIFPCSNEDNIFFGKLNSGDYLMSLEVGAKYNFKTVGWRIPILSAFPNIVEYATLGE